MPESAPLSIEVSFDLICPWCFIGKRHLEAALAQLQRERPGLAAAVTWRSVPLIPATPLAGIPYREFYVARLGSPAAVAMRQGQVQAAAREAGLTIAFDKMVTFPNTLLAHRLVQFAQQAQGAEAASRLIEDLFARYFLRGEDIGDAEVLKAALRACDVELPPDAEDALPSLEDPQDAGAEGVPYYVFDRRLALSGAQPPEVLLRAIRQARPD